LKSHPLTQPLPLKGERRMVFMDGHKLILNTLDADSLTEVELLRKNHTRSLSFPDCSCLYLAISKSAYLLTGDKSLRIAAQSNKIPVHGILWVFDQLLSTGIITSYTAHKKLSDLLSINNRLPIDESNLRLKRWKKNMKR
jgi:predicted nucleic acid-binding protein